MTMYESLDGSQGFEREVLEALRRRVSKKRLCFFPYIGGKFALFSRLVRMIPPHEIYVEVFGGAASLLLNKPRSRVEVYNDVDGELVNLFLVMRDQRDTFVERFRWVLYSRGMYDRWLGEPAPDDAVERAVRFYYVLRCSFSGKYGASWAFKRRAQRHAPDVFWSALDRMELVSKRLKGCYIDGLDFRRCVANWDTADTFFFCDPPYYGPSYYRKGFSEQDHVDLRETLGRVKGKWLLTYGDHPKVRELYAGYETREASVPRVAGLLKLGGKRTRLNNLVIANYPLGVCRDG